uniref:DUF6286 domain-containing protein n=1 Tax=Nonomuraea pusilla TaxID=46177 RepID=UPI0006E2B9E1|nr:DUF6286 domain-containing protein [Nonomuraea pusilla]
MTAADEPGVRGAGEPTARDPGARAPGGPEHGGPEHSGPEHSGPEHGGRAPGRGRQERAADRAAVRAFRPHRTVPAVVVAALVTLAGLYVAAETVSALVGAPLRLLPYDRMLAWASSTPWSDPLLLLGAAVATLVGLALLATALVPGRPRMIPVRTGDPDLVIGMRRKSFSSALAHAAEEVPGVHGARARLRGRTVAVTPFTSGWDEEGFARAVRDAVLTRMAALQPVEPYRVAVNVKERR